MRVPQLIRQLSSDRRRLKLALSALGTLGTKVASAALGVAVSVALARALGVRDFGIYSFVFALTSLIAIPTQVGLPSLIVRETAKLHATHEWSELSGLWRWTTAIVIALSFSIAAVSGFAMLAFSRKIPPEYTHVMVPALGLIPLIALGNLRGAALRGLRKIVLGQLPEHILRPSILLALAVFAPLVFGKERLSAIDGMSLHLIAAFGSFVIGAAILVANSPREAKTRPTYSHRPDWVKAMLPLALLAGMQVANQHVGVLLLGLIAGPDDVGLYRAAAQGGALIVFGTMAVDSVVSPWFARFHSQEDHRGLARATRMATIASAGVALPIAGLMIFSGGPLLKVAFGEEFVSAYGPLVVIALGRFISSLFGPQVALLNMTANERFSAQGVLIALLINILVGALLIPYFGMMGAALASAASMLCWNGLMWAAIRRRLHLNSFLLSKGAASER